MRRETGGGGGNGDWQKQQEEPLEPRGRARCLHEYRLTLFLPSYYYYYYHPQPTRLLLSHKAWLDGAGPMNLASQSGETGCSQLLFANFNQDNT